MKDGDQFFKQTLSNLLKFLKSKQVLDKMMLRIGFENFICTKLKKIKRHSAQQNLQKIQTNLTEYFQYENIEVEEEVKLKTTCFYKWCRFIEVCRQIKQQRIEEINNIKKSTCFNSYALKFNAFILWKRHLKYKKLQYEKIATIKFKINKRYFEETIEQFLQKYQINKIEQALTKVVSSKIDSIKKNQFFKGLALNLLKGRRNIQETKQYSNIYCYRFLALISSNQNQKRKKSLINIRNASQKNYQRLCAKESIKSFKQLVLYSKNNIKKVQKIRKNIGLCIFSQIVGLDKLKSSKVRTLKEYLRNKSCLYFFSMLNKYIFQRNDEKSTLMRIEKCIKTGTLSKFVTSITSEIRLGKQIKTKMLQIQTHLLKAKFKKFYHGISSLTELQLIIYAKNQNIRKLRRLSLFKTWNLNRKNASILNKEIQLIQNKINVELLKKSFQGMALSPSFKQIQQGLLIRASYLYNKIVKRAAMKRIKQKKAQNQKIIELCSISERIITRYIHYKIFKKSIKIAKRLNQILTNRESNLKFYLLQVLKTIKGQSFANQTKLKNVLVGLTKTRMIKSLKVNLYLARNVQLVEKINDRLRLKESLKIIKNSKDRNILERKNTIILNGVYIIRKMIQYFSKRQNKRQQVYQNSLILNSIRINDKFKNFQQRLEGFYTSSVNYNKKVTNLSLKLLSLKFLSVKKKFTRQIKSNQQNLKQKAKEIKKILTNFLFKEIALRTQIKKLKDCEQKNNKSSFINQLVLVKKLSSKAKLLKKKLSLKRIEQNALKSINHREKVAKYQRQQSRLLDEFLRKKLNFEKVVGIQLLKDKNQMRKKRNNIDKFLLRQKLRIFVRSFFLIHSQTIKKKVAILHYARNLKKKVLSRFAINCIEYRQKQNNKEVEKTNTLANIEKIMEKSRRSDNIIEKINRFNMSRSRQMYR